MSAAPYDIAKATAPSAMKLRMEQAWAYIAELQERQAVSDARISALEAKLAEKKPKK
jgi:hypothetical protein